MTLTSDQRGQARSPGLSYQQLLDTDTHPVAPSLRLESPAYFGDADYPVANYTSREVHELEKERLWRRVWQMACREEDLPDVGDTVVYEICDISILVVRSTPGEIKGLLQRLPAPRAAPAGLGRTRDRAALPVPRLLLEPRRIACSTCRANGTSLTSPSAPPSSTCPR